MNTVCGGTVKEGSQRSSRATSEGRTQLTADVLVALVALVCRVAVMLPALVDSRRFYVRPDSFEYDQLALNLIHGHGYSLALTPPYVPDLRRTPVYPLLLAVIYAAVGHEPRLAIAVNVALGVLTCVLAAVLGRRAFGVGMLAGLFLATDPTSIAYSLTLMTETLFTVLTVLCTLALLQTIRDPDQRSVPGGAIMTGVWCGIAILTRPIAVLLPLVLGPVLAILQPAARRARRQSLLLIVTLAVAFPAAWSVRNYLVAGLAQPTSLIAINAYVYRAAPLQAQERGAPVNAEGEESDDEQSATTAIPPEERTGQLVAFEQSAINTILADPVGYARLNLAGVASMLGPDRDILPRLLAGPVRTTGASNARGSGPTRGAVPLLAEKLQLGILYLFAAIGAASALASPTRRAPAMVLVVFIGYFLVLSGPEAYPRFRVPVMPFIAVLAAGGVYRCWNALTQWSSHLFPNDDPNRNKEFH